MVGAGSKRKDASGHGRWLAVGLVVTLLSGCLPRATENDPIFRSVGANDLKAVEAFLSNGGDANLKNREGETLLYVAAGQSEASGIASLLISAGANTEEPTASGRTPLLNALGWCHVEMVRVLLAAGASVAELSEPNLKKAACPAPQDSRNTVMMLVAQARR